MSTKGRNAATYPVWVGNLKETVKEEDLRRAFSKYTHQNGIASCKVVRSQNGQSKRFGYVNFYSEEDAELAARMMAGFRIESVPIKTKGPSVLEAEGRFSRDKRHLTDCPFYVETGNCTNREQCLYRHNEQARASTEVCPQWTEKKCSSSGCPYRHPGGMSTSKGEGTSGQAVNHKTIQSKDTPDVRNVTDLEPERNTQACPLVTSPWLDIVKGGPGDGIGYGDSTNRGDETSGNGGVSLVTPSLYPSLRLEPVGVFWDIENCPVPVEKSAFALANKIRKVFFAGKQEAEFVCVCDITKERRWVVDALNKAQVTVVHVSAVAKNAADDKLRQSLHRFANTYHPPCTVVLISGDVNFAPELKGLRYTHNITITLVHNKQASEALKGFANNLVLYDDLLQDVEPAHPPPQRPSKCTVLVTGLPKKAEKNKVAGILGVMSDNCGGKVLSVDLAAGVAHIVYRDYDSAVKSSRRLTGERVFGSTITAVVIPGDQPSSTASLMLTPPHLPLAPPTTRIPLRPVSGPQPQPQQPVFRAQFQPPPQEFPPLFAHAGFPPAPHPLPLPGHTANYGHPIRGQPPPFQRPILPLPFLGPRPPHNFLPPVQQLPLRGGGALDAEAPLPLQQAAPLPPFSEYLLVTTRCSHPVRTDELNERVLRICAQSSVKADIVHVLWYSYSELHVLLRLDILQSSIEQKDTVAGLCQNGRLTPEIAKYFAKVCCSAIEKTVQQEWKVEVCMWKEEEERDGLIRSHVIEVLMKTPTRWMKWSQFRGKYLQCWKESISEMGVRTACKGAVTILNTRVQTEQVVVISEFDPLVRVCHDPRTAQTLKENVMSLLTKHSSRIRWLDIVSEFTSSFGPLPLLPNGKPFTEVIESIPEIKLEGNTLSNRFIVLKKAKVQSTVPSATPKHKPSITSKPFGILINTRCRQPENLQEFKGLLAEICQQSTVITEPAIFLKYRYSEFHIYLRVDILKSAIAQNDGVAKLCQKGTLPPMAAKIFVGVCRDALHKVCKQKGLQWSVEVCQWGEEELKSRQRRSQVIDMLEQSPSKWMTWSDFRNFYFKRFEVMIESVKSYKTAVIILSTPPDNQVICFRELSPLIMLKRDEMALQSVTKNVVGLLGAQPDKTIPLLSIVEHYNDRFGNLPLSTDKQEVPFCDLLRSTPGIEVRGEKLSDQVVVLLDEQGLCLQASAEKNSSSSSENKVTGTKNQHTISDSFMDEVTAILFSSPTQTLSVNQLTQQYNKFFPPASGKLSTVDIANALKQLPNIQITPGKKGAFIVSLRNTSEAEQPSQSAPLPHPNEPPMQSAPPETEWRAICCEVERFLLCDSEHAMTLAELVEHLNAAEYPVLSPDSLHQHLKKAIAEQETFRIDYVPSSMADSVVQLNLGRCLKKLCDDLLHVFVHLATLDHPLPWDTIRLSYAILCGHQLKPATYGFNDVHELLKYTKMIIQFDHSTGMCSLTEGGAKQVLKSLLTELLFVRQKVHLDQLADLYLDYFEVPLHLCGATSFTALMNQQLFASTFEVQDDIIDLRPDVRFAEQLRSLLTVHRGKIPLNQLGELLCAKFGGPLADASASELRTRCVNVGSHVASCTNTDCLVWGPSAHPYPPRRNGSDPYERKAPPPATNKELPAPSKTFVSPVVQEQSSTPVLLQETTLRYTAGDVMVKETNPTASGVLASGVQFDESEMWGMLEDLHAINDPSSGELDVDKLDRCLDYFLEITNREVARYRPPQYPVAKPRTKLACQFGGRTPSV